MLQVGCSRERRHRGPVRRCGSAHLCTVKLETEKQISTARFDSARPNVLAEKTALDTKLSYLVALTAFTMQSGFYILSKLWAGK